MGDAALGHLTALEQLRELRLPFSQITDSGIAQLEACPQLHTLDLTAAQSLTASPSIDDTALAHLCELPAIAALDLREAYPISGAGLARLGNLPALQNLKLTSDARTEKRYRASASASHLRSGAPSVTKAGI